MRAFTELVKNWLIPGSMPFLLGGTVVAAILCNGGATAQLVGRAWLTLLALTYLLLSLPAVSTALIGLLGDGYGTIRDLASARSARVLVVVGNGSVHYSDGTASVDYLTRRSVFCAFEALRLHSLIDPALVVVTGGVAGHPGAPPESRLIREFLVTHGVPSQRILEEPNSRTTEEQVHNVLALLGERNENGPLVVVTTSAHMRRVVSLFERSGATVFPSVTPELRYDDARRGWRRWWPSMAALTGSSSAMYEYLANIRGVLSPRRSGTDSTGRLRD